MEMTVLLPLTAKRLLMLALRFPGQMFEFPVLFPFQIPILFGTQTMSFVTACYTLFFLLPYDTIDPLPFSQNAS